MQGRDWALVIFTLLVQMAVGSLFALAIFIFGDPTILPESVIADLNLIVLILVPALLILGLLSAIPHLSHPGRSRLAMGNFKKSWLSREMFLGICFTISSLILMILHLLDIEPKNIQAVLIGVSMLCGVLLLYSMSRIYMLRTVPTWNTWGTPISFFLSAGLLGTLSLSLAVNIAAQGYAHTEASLTAMGDLCHIFGWTSAILLSIQLFIAFMKDRFLIWRGGVSRESIQLLKQRYPIPGILRGTFGFLAIGLCIIFALLPFSNTNPGLFTAIIMAFLLALTSEILGRFLFYASFKSSGI